MKRLDGDDEKAICFLCFSNGFGLLKRGPDCLTLLILYMDEWYRNPSLDLLNP